MASGGATTFEQLVTSSSDAELVRTVRMQMQEFAAGSAAELALPGLSSEQRHLMHLLVAELGVQLV